VFVSAWEVVFKMFCVRKDHQVVRAFFWTILLVSKSMKNK